MLIRSKSTRKGIFSNNGEVIDQKFEFAEVRLRRAISLTSDIATFRRLLHWIAWSFRYQIDLSIVEFAQQMMELRRYYWPADFRSYMIESLQAGNKRLKKGRTCYSLSASKHLPDYILSFIRRATLQQILDHDFFKEDPFKITVKWVGPTKMELSLKAQDDSTQISFDSKDAKPEELVKYMVRQCSYCD